MNRTEHLNAIAARCRELLAMAEGRTTGEFRVGRISMPGYALLQAGDKWGSGAISVQLKSGDAAYIASCAGNAERGWETTTGEIEAILPHLTDSPVKSVFTQWHTLSVFCNERADAICRAWPVELLGVCDEKESE